LIPPVDIQELAPQAQKILDESANPKLRLAAARGIVPGLKPIDLVSVLVAFASGPGTDELAKTARATIAGLPAQVLKGVLSGDLQPLVVDALARSQAAQADPIAALLRMPRIHFETVEWLAQHGNEAVTELVATNQERLIQHPRVMELLYLNEATRMSTADRVVEFAVRSGVELHGIAAWKEVARAIEGELVPEAADEPLPEDLEFKEAAELAKQLEDDSIIHPFEETEEGEETLVEKFKPLYQRIAEMNVSQKVRRAQLGTKEERALLLRDSNRLVAAAAIRSPRIQEPEVVLVSNNRNVCEDVLRIIGNSGEWLKSYQVKKNLVENPRTPLGIAQKLVVQLRETDLKRLSGDKNVSSSVRLAAKRHLGRRKT